MAKSDDFLSVVEKFQEVAFFLQKLESTGDPVEAGYYTNAFANSCYSATNRIKHLCRDSAEMKDWWEPNFVALTKHPIDSFFHQARNADVHKGIDLVNGIEVAMDFETGTVRMMGMLRRDTSYSPKAIADECRNYFRLLIRLSIVDGYRRFATAWDPTGALSEAVGTLKREALVPMV